MWRRYRPDRSVWTHSQAVAEKIALRHFPAPFAVALACLKADHMRTLQGNLRRILDGDDPFVFIDQAGQRIQQRRLAGAGSAGHKDIQATARRNFQEPADCS